MAMPLLVLLLGTLALVADGKHIAVLGGMMKSHHLTVVPLIEELAARGHEVSFLLPNTTEYRTFFASRASSARMEYLGTQEWSFNSLFTGPEYDFKNLPWYKKPIVLVKMILSYREALDAPLFSMHDELVQWLNTTKVDAILMHTASFGSKPAVKDSGVPWISYFSVPPLPLFMVHDRDKVCRYPNHMRPPSVAQLKASLVTRVKNHMILHAGVAEHGHPRVDGVSDPAPAAVRQERAHGRVLQDLRLGCEKFNAHALALLREELRERFLLRGPQRP